MKVSQSPEDVLTCCAWNKDNNKFVVSIGALVVLFQSFNDNYKFQTIFFRWAEFVAIFINAIWKVTY